jgi:ABC-type phosphate transport system substrate-binding protein|tara:strand:- start:2246 stop:2653 length:408 start_codon:yes stop_codon:yes gene_type:complete
MIPLCLLFVSFYAKSTEFVVVVNKSNAVNALSKREIIDIYMGRYLTFPDGETSKPLDLPAQSALKNDFYLKLVNKDEQKINAYWARLLFSGRAKPPTPSASVEDAINKIAASQFAIGYIPLSQVTDAVKVVYTFD